MFPKSIETTKEEMLFLFERMTLIRKVEVASDVSYKAQQIRGFCHLYDGQEAVITGLEAVLNYDDCLITSYREHGHMLTRGDSVYSIMCEQMGKWDGCSHGKGGSMHLYRGETNFYGGCGIVGSQIALGTGLGFALKYKGTKNVSVTMYGDGASNQGQFFESVNMAKLWNLPVIYVCENNRYGFGTPIKMSCSNCDFYTRGDAMPGVQMDGMNVFMVKAATQVAKNYAVENGPMLMEVKTYRYHGHSMSDPGTAYRTKEEVDNVRKTQDCIGVLTGLIVKNKVATEEQLEELEEKIDTRVKAETEKARNAPWPDQKELYTHVYINNEYPVRGVEPGTGMNIKLY